MGNTPKRQSSFELENDISIADQKTRLVVTLQGEAAVRLLMWAEQNHVHKNVAGREFVIKGMIEDGLLLKGYSAALGNKWD